MDEGRREGGSEGDIVLEEEEEEEEDLSTSERTQVG